MAGQAHHGIGLANLGHKLSAYIVVFIVTVCIWFRLRPATFLSRGCIGFRLRA